MKEAINMNNMLERKIHSLFEITEAYLKKYNISNEYYGEMMELIDITLYDGEDLDEVIKNEFGII